MLGEAQLPLYVTSCFSNTLKLSQQIGFDGVRHIILIKNPFSEEHSSLRALWADRPMTATSIISSQAPLTYCTIHGRNDWQGQWPIQILDMWIRRTITTLLLPINHTVSGTGGWHYFTIYDSNRQKLYSFPVGLVAWDIGRVLTKSLVWPWTFIICHLSLLFLLSPQLCTLQ